MKLRNEAEVGAFLHAQETERCTTCAEWATCLSPDACRQAEKTDWNLAGAVVLVSACAVAGAALAILTGAV